MKQPPHKCLAAWLLALIMALTMLPVGVLALEEVDDGAQYCVIVPLLGPITERRRSPEEVIFSKHGGFAPPDDFAFPLLL